MNGIRVMRRSLLVSRSLTTSSTSAVGRDEQRKPFFKKKLDAEHRPAFGDGNSGPRRWEDRNNKTKNDTNKFKVNSEKPFKSYNKNDNKRRTEEDRSAYLTAIRGMTPTSFMDAIYKEQMDNPIKFSDQNLAESFGLSVNKIQSILKFKDYLVNFYDKTNVNPKVNEEDHAVKNLMGLFSVDAMRKNSNSLQRFKEIVKDQGTKYSLSESTKGLLEKRQKGLLADENLESFLNSIEKKPATLNSKKPIPSPVKESALTAAEKEAIIMSGKLPMVEGKPHTISVGFFKRQVERATRLTDEKQEFKFYPFEKVDNK